MKTLIKKEMPVYTLQVADVEAILGREISDLEAKFIRDNFSIYDWEDQLAEFLTNNGIE